MDYNSKFFTNRLKALSPYTAGEQPKDKKIIKLNTNENPYPPSPKIKDAINSEMDALRLYPDPDNTSLCEAIAIAENVRAECVFCGNGSDEILSFVFYSFFEYDLPLLFPDVTYSFYPVYANYYGIPYKQIALNDKFEIAADDYLQPASGVIFPNPNAPTSAYLDRGEICKLLEYHMEKVVAVDEAYIAFGGESMADLVDKYPNLLVVKTLSKSHALAGMRLGYAIGGPHLIEALKRARDSFNSYTVDRLASAAAKAALSDTDYYAKINGRIIETRDNFIEKMEDLGFACIKSKANFVFVTHKTALAEELYLKLKERGILVRYFNKPRIDNHLRISIGTKENMEHLLDALGELV
jgi:histidinol-phosphate aminotransferase